MANNEKTFIRTGVYLWGERVGSVVWNGQIYKTEFSYDSQFIKKGLQIAPIKMPLLEKIYAFSSWDNEGPPGLPGLLAASLPDRFGRRLIVASLEVDGRRGESLNPVEQLYYIGTRGMGALEYIIEDFSETLRTYPSYSGPLDIDELFEIAAAVPDSWHNDKSFEFLKTYRKALHILYQVGSPVGGNRAKALIAFNPSNGEVLPGRADVPDGFEHWIIKFDGANKKSLGDSVGVGRIEYAYHLMAVEAGIKMMPCRLLEENGRAHFMTKRFDRLPGNEKVHVQSLWALQHYNHSLAYEYRYEQVFDTILELQLGTESIQEMYRRMVFNILARNQDDHTKNIAFMMNKTGSWQLTPAFDIVWQYSQPSPKGLFADLISDGGESRGHLLSVNGKHDNFTIGDLESVADRYGIFKAKEICNQVADAVALWPRFAKKAGIKTEIIRALKSTFRLHILDLGHSV